MAPEAALIEQIERYRKMTGEQRLMIGFTLNELVRESARAGIRHEFAQADEAEVERLLRERLLLARKQGKDLDSVFEELAHAGDGVSHCLLSR